MNLHWASLLLLLTISRANCRNLLLAQVISRHGDRAPDVTYPNDEYIAKDWPRGYSELTNEGMQETYRLGQFYRKRYVDSTFLAPEYNKDEIYTRSTDVPRALTSAQSILFGLYPATGEDVWMNGTSWQPLPVHGFMPASDDLLLKPTSVNCPAKVAAWTTLTKDLFEQYDIEYADFFEYIANVTGMRPMNMNKISHIYDAVSCERNHNMTHAWAEAQWKNSTKTVFDTIVELKQVFRISQFSQPPLYNFTGGYLLFDFVDRMQKKAANISTVPQKMIIYSSHDGTVTALMYAMGVGNGQLTPYASAVMLELYQNDQNGFEVGVFFRNDSYAEQPIELQIPGCGGNICTLEAFALSLQSVMYRTRSDYNRDCGLPEEGTTPTFFVSTTSGGSTQKAAQTADDQNRVPDYIAWILGGLCLILLFALILALCCCCRIQKKHRHNNRS